MKTFIAALIIFVLLFSLVLTSDFYVQKRTGELLLLAYALPESSEEFDADGELTKKTLALLQAWEKSKHFFNFIMNRDITDKADEAVQALFAAVRAESAENFLPARLRFIALAERMALAFSVSAESIL